MAYDEDLVHRVRAQLESVRVCAEKKMFGGLCFLVNGNMCCGIVGDTLMVRVGPGHHDTALGQPHVRPMDFTGTPMRGMIYVAPEGVVEEAGLAYWVHQGAAFAGSLPPK